MNEALLKLESIRDEHDVYGKKLIELSEGKIYPCHAIYLAVLNRSLELYDGFLLLAKKGNYGCCMGLLRMQLDNILRFYGVLITEDQHKTANEIFNGTQLNKIKDKDGNQLRDFYLVKCLSEQNDWIEHVYKLCCGYIHLSDQHIIHMLDRADVEADGKRTFIISSTDEHIEEKHRVELINAFTEITQGVFKLFTEWKKVSSKYNSTELDEKYKKIV